MRTARQGLPCGCDDTPDRTATPSRARVTMDGGSMVLSLGILGVRTNAFAEMTALLWDVLGLEIVGPDRGAA